MQGHSQATHGEMDGTTRFSASNRSRTRYPKVAQIVRHVAAEGETVLRDFKNAEIEDISECRATVRPRMVKQMLRRDLPHQIDPGRDIQGRLR